MIFNVMAGSILCGSIVIGKDNRQCFRAVSGKFIHSSYLSGVGIIDKVAGYKRLRLERVS